MQTTKCNKQTNNTEEYPIIPGKNTCVSKKECWKVLSFFVERQYSLSQKMVLSLSFPPFYHYHMILILSLRESQFIHPSISNFSACLRTWETCNISGSDIIVSFLLSNRYHTI